MGTGPTTVIVAMGAMVVEPKLTIVLASFVNIFGGLAMVRVDPVPLAPKYWVPVTVLMVLGSVAGALALKAVPNRSFVVILGSAFLLTAVWFLLRTPAPAPAAPPPGRADGLDLAVGAFAGFCGGFIGINAPPLVLHFGRRLNKRLLRRLLVLIFTPAAAAQTATFMANGMFDRRVLVWGVVMLPAMAAGIYLGNHTFHRISETWFRRILGVLLVVVSARLLLRGIS